MTGPWSNRTDGDLLRSRDAEAFREFYVRYERVVLVFVGGKVRNAEVAADITAETFAAAMLAAERFRDDGSPAVGWLLGIARNLVRRHFERQDIESRARRRLGIERMDITDASLERVEALLDAEHPDNPILALLEQLPVDQREAVRAHVVDEQGYAEIARHRGISEGLARQRVSRGLRWLRTSIKEGES
ncbi:MAG TPA: sigma-70 family RNA polymerase sigma factor [Solirubrobacter sp.]|nr:sigma-70 family RNA polymerase sigma factor [Solirubrobacter sp.]